MKSSCSKWNKEKAFQPPYDPLSGILFFTLCVTLAELLRIHVSKDFLWYFIRVLEGISFIFSLWVLFSLALNAMGNEDCLKWRNSTCTKYVVGFSMGSATTLTLGLAIGYAIFLQNVGERYVLYFVGVIWAVISVFGTRGRSRLTGIGDGAKQVAGQPPPSGSSSGNNRLKEDIVETKETQEVEEEEEEKGRLALIERGAKGSNFSACLKRLCDCLKSIGEKVCKCLRRAFSSCTSSKLSRIEKRLDVIDARLEVIEQAKPLQTYCRKSIVKELCKIDKRLERIEKKVDRQGRFAQGTFYWVAAATLGGLGLTFVYVVDKEPITSTNWSVTGFILVGAGIVFGLFSIYERFRGNK